MLVQEPRTAIVNAVIQKIRQWMIGVALVAVLSILHSIGMYFMEIICYGFWAIPLPDARAEIVINSGSRMLSFRKPCLYAEFKVQDWDVTSMWSISV